MGSRRRIGIAAEPATQLGHRVERQGQTLERFGWRVLYALGFAAVIALLLASVGWLTPIGIPLRWNAAATATMFCIVFVLDPLSDELTDRRLIAWRGPGFCERCGYDLRASPDRCPECGAPVAK